MKLILQLSLLLVVLAQSSNLPPGVPRGAFNPLAWSQLIDYRDCPGVNTTQKWCKYPGTPLSGQVTWTCPAGNFCVGPGEISLCTPGFFCPNDTTQAIYCPAGFVCNNDTTTISLCPKNRFCPRGTVTPKNCGYLAFCPEGSENADKFAVVVVFGLVCLTIYCLYELREKAEHLREIKRKKELALIHDISRHSEKPEIQRLEKTFDIEFENLGLKLPNGVEIMKGVTGSLRSGRCCAIMGPSGSGKTTFVTLLTGKVSRTTGTVKLNGVKDELSKWSKLIGYVPQEDIMLRELTVRDILMHSARMRLPSSWDYHRIKQKVNEIITFLGMAHVSNSIIGDETRRGISGGQRKRVNIGMELVAEPSVLFLDEPTSGLDSSTAFEVCSNLKQIAQSQGLTVAAVIHSPSPATFRQFDDFLLLGKGGRLVYMGPRDKALEYFARIGFTCPADESPSDYFMDVASGFVPSQFDPAFKPQDLFTYWETQGAQFAGKKKMTPEQALAAQLKHHSSMKVDNGDTPAAPERKADDYYAFADYIVSGIAYVYLGFKAFFVDVATEFGEFCVSIIYMSIGKQDPVRQNQPLYFQLWFLMKRAYHQVYSSAEATLVDLSLNFFAGAFISVAIQKFGYLGGSPKIMCAWAPVNVQYQCSAPTDQIGLAAMFICLGCMFAGISIAGNTFGKEKVVYWRDTASGMPVLPYFFAKFIIDIPRIVIGGSMFSLALVVFFPYQQPFVRMYGMVIILYFYSFAVGYCLSIFVEFSKLAIFGTGMSLLWALVLSGVMPQLWDVLGHGDTEGFPSGIQWLWHVSAPRWLIESFYIQEVQHLPFVEKFGKASNNYDFDNYELDIKNAILISLGWYFMTLLALKLVNRAKQK
ncbi:hypothetical protein BC833DRAFT_573455 [Globomyces pollinis-pini]|nr:hypothetical protein BC833DRAFT_573455 [Globomyces pollinis-pini]